MNTKPTYLTNEGFDRYCSILDWLAVAFCAFIALMIALYGFYAYDRANDVSATFTGTPSCGIGTNVVVDLNEPIPCNLNRTNTLLITGASREWADQHGCRYIEGTAGRGDAVDCDF